MSDHRRRRRPNAAESAPAAPTQAAALARAQPVSARRASQLAVAAGQDRPRPRRFKWQSLRGYAMTALTLAGAGLLALGLYLLRPDPEPAPAPSAAGEDDAPATAGDDAAGEAVAVASRPPEAIDDSGEASIIMPEGSLQGDGVPVRLPAPPAPRPGDAASRVAAGPADGAADGVHVAAIQRHLAALAFEPGRTDGVLDDRTRQAIERFQEFAGLEVTGEPSPALAQELAALAETAAR